MGTITTTNVYTLEALLIAISNISLTPKFKLDDVSIVLNVLLPKFLHILIASFN